MSEKFTIEIIAPDKTILKTDAHEVTIPSFEGEMGILKDHIPLITFLRPGLIKIFNEVETTYFIEEGTVEFSDNKLLILTSTAIDLSKIDKKFMEALINKSETKISKSSISDKERYLLNHKIETLKSIS